MGFLVIAVAVNLTSTEIWANSAMYSTVQGSVQSDAVHCTVHCSIKKLSLRQYSRVHSKVKSLKLYIGAV